MACDIDDREGESPSPMEPRLGRMFHSSATGRRRDQTLPEALGLRQALELTNAYLAADQRVCPRRSAGSRNGQCPCIAADADRGATDPADWSAPRAGPPRGQDHARQQVVSPPPGSAVPLTARRSYDSRHERMAPPVRSALARVSPLASAVAVYVCPVWRPWFMAIGGMMGRCARSCRSRLCPGRAPRRIDGAIHRAGARNVPGQRDRWRHRHPWHRAAAQARARARAEPAGRRQSGRTLPAPDPKL